MLGKAETWLLGACLTPLIVASRSGLAAVAHGMHLAAPWQGRYAGLLQTLCVLLELYNLQAHAPIQTQGDWHAR